MATPDATQFLNRQDEMGTVEEGKLADRCCSKPSPSMTWPTLLAGGR
jgi:hypothetical protein